jgi:hypothetical protein
MLTLLAVLWLPGIGVAQEKGLSKEREEQIQRAQQAVEFRRNAANDADRRVREAEYRLSAAKGRQRAAEKEVSEAKWALERAESDLTTARERAVAAREAYQAESDKFQELRRAQ